MTAENAMDIVISLESVQEMLRILAEKMEKDTLKNTPEDLKETINCYVREIGWIVASLKNAKVDFEGRKFNFEKKLVEC